MRNSCLILLVSLMMLGIACDEETMNTSDNYVIEAFIVANESIDNVTIKGILPLERVVPQDESITDAQVRIIHDNEEADLEFDQVSRKYVNPEGDFAVNVGGIYRLEVNVDGREATAETVVPNPPTGVTLSDTEIIIPQLTVNPQLGDQIRALFDEARLTFSWDAIPGQSFFVVIERKEDQLDPILPEQIPVNTRQLIGEFRFISEPSDDNSFEIIGVALETYGLHVAKVFTVNQEYIDLFENLEQDSRDLNEPPSNISNALGIFTAFAVDSVEFNVVRE